MRRDAVREDRLAQPYVVQRVAGKLLGVRAGKLEVMADWLNLSTSVRRVAEEIPGPIVICADYRQLQVMHEELAKPLLEEFRQFNSKVRRSALMMPSNAPTLRRQMERLLREAQHSGRRVCVDPAEVKAWLSSCLDDGERLGLDDFLAASERWSGSQRIAGPATR